VSGERGALDRLEQGPGPGLPDPMESPIPPAPSVPPSGLQRTRVLERRAILLGLGISFFLHIWAIWLYPGFMDRAPELVMAPALSPPDILLQGIEVVSVREVEDEPVAEEEEQPPPEIIFDLPEPLDASVPDALALPTRPVLPTPGTGAVTRTEVEDRRTAAERLRPQMGDPRLWAPLERSLLDLSDVERAEIILRSMILDWSDSLAVAVALSGDATDWTFTDDEGRRWGLSPGRLHLGDFSIPLPLSFQVPPGRREEFARRDWEMRDILRGTASAEVRRSWAERAREIRQRMDEERARAGGTVPPGGGFD